MPKPGGPSAGSLTSYYRRYSPEGLLATYARGRVRLFWQRQAVVLVAGLLLMGIVSAGAGLLTYTLALAADLADTLYLRRVPKLLESGASRRRISLISAALGLLYASALCFMAALPVLLPAVGGDGWSGSPQDVLFTIGVLACATINTGFFLPYHRLAAVSQNLIYALVPSLIILSDSGAGQSGEPLHLAGYAILLVAELWFLSFVSDRHHRSKRNMKAQAQQQQKLEEAYARLIEQQLEARQLALVAEQANDSIMLMDRDGVLTWVNDAFTRITGYSFAEAVGRTPRDLLHDPDIEQIEARQLEDERNRMEPFRAEVRNRRKDGAAVWLETNQVPMLDEDGELVTFIAVERDVTAAKRHELQLDDARRAAEDGARVKAEFLATMSHEIRTPMNGIIGMAQLLAESHLDADQQLYASTILGSARTLLSLINDVLDLSKMEAGELSIDCADFSPRDCFEETVRLLRPQAEEKGLAVTLEFGAGVPDLLHGDDRRLRQILLNLGGNAIKFTESGEVSVQVRAGPEGSGTLLEFSVRDTGIGIPGDKLDAVFDRFSQADAAISRRFGGTGLGLTISRRLADAMGGRIAVVSGEGQGSCFTVSLPFAAASGTAAGTDSTQRADSGAGLGGLRVLVAEDNRVNQLLVRKFLGGTGIDMTFADDGGAAVELAARVRPDIVLMDMSMPVMDGLEATRAIRAGGLPQPVIIALTANAFDTDREACLDAGMDDFLTKPVDRGALIAALRRHARGAGGGRAAR